MMATIIKKYPFFVSNTILFCFVGFHISFLPFNTISDNINSQFVQLQLSAKGGYGTLSRECKGSRNCQTHLPYTPGNISFFLPVNGDPAPWNWCQLCNHFYHYCSDNVNKTCGGEEMAGPPGGPYVGIGTGGTRVGCS